MPEANAEPGGGGPGSVAPRWWGSPAAEPVPAKGAPRSGSTSRPAGAGGRRPACLPGRFDPFAGSGLKPAGDQQDDQHDQQDAAEAEAGAA